MCNSALFSKNKKTGGKSEMKNEKVSRLLLKLVEGVVRNEVDINLHDWPPKCIGIYHQPKRPKERTVK